MRREVGVGKSRPTAPAAAAVHGSKCERTITIRQKIISKARLSNVGKCRNVVVCDRKCVPEMMVHVSAPCTDHDWLGGWMDVKLEGYEICFSSLSLSRALALWLSSKVYLCPRREVGTDCLCQVYSGRKVLQFLSWVWLSIRACTLHEDESSSAREIRKEVRSSSHLP